MKIDKMINENYEYQKQYIAEWERKIIEVTDFEDETEDVEFSDEFYASNKNLEDYNYDPQDRRYRNP